MSNERISARFLSDETHNHLISHGFVVVEFYAAIRKLRNMARKANTKSNVTVPEWKRPKMHDSTSHASLFRENEIIYTVRIYYLCFLNYFPKTWRVIAR